MTARLTGQWLSERLGQQFIALHQRIAAGENPDGQYRRATAGPRSRGDGQIVRGFEKLYALSITTAKAMGLLALSGIIFALTLAGILLGALLRRTLPKHHLSEDAQNTVRLGVGLIATIAALVLGLLISKGLVRYPEHADQADHR